MEPGRELDVLIAEKVFGETVVHTVWGDYGQYHAYCIGEPDYDYSGENYGGVLSNPVPHYSTDIAAAWTVMVALTRFNCCPELLGDYNYRWRVRLTMGYPREGDHKPYVSVECDEAPHAICLAALKAIEYKNSLTKSP
jgi:hypothetical protein